MCGIAGIVYGNHQSTGTFSDHQDVLELLKHRGPDLQKHCSVPGADFYHSRLVILDPSAHSNQPFKTAHAVQTLVYNGEIFNYRALAHQHGLPEPIGDVEVLYSLLQQKGKKTLQDLNGFFAFAFYDEGQKRLLLARDRYGVKPLYYYADNEKLVFASELKPLLRITGPQALDTDQLYSYFRLNYCSGTRTIFKNIFRLQPGSCLEWKGGQLSFSTWYSVPAFDAGQSLPELLGDAVKIRLHADVPVGAFLSGGLDSSIVSALAKSFKPDLKTYSLGFRDNAYLDESVYAERVAAHLQTDHKTLLLHEDDFVHEMPGFMRSIDEPFADSSAFNVYMLSRFSGTDLRVALSGDGADELFKGYLKHRALLFGKHPALRFLVKASTLLPVWAMSSREKTWPNRIRQIRKMQALTRLSSTEQQEMLASISNDETCRMLLGQHVSSAYFKSLFTCNTIFQNCQEEDCFDVQSVLADDMLVKADRFSMRHGLEIRNPFLDYRVVHHALHLADNEKIKIRQQKIPLRKHFAHLLPAETLHRPKKGFELPLKSWLLGRLNSELENNWLAEERIREEGFLDFEAVKQAMQKLKSGDSGDSAARIWAIAVFQNWTFHFKDYILKHAQSPAHHQPL
ncbi:MAG TPA: asparagine synthase (glutamine-hydrolyzing) [Bacteroidia bacterium]|nr:asparagine synthase (glutamine-hydrolyzing) [Bacteroidia bacterium]